ncbi:MAG: tyrosine-type recombinase/integrase, partial [Opitutaceae bacterium]
MARRAHNPTDDFAGLVQRFFAEYLATQRNLSPHTRLSYRNTFRLLLHFLAEQNRRSIDQLTLAALTPESILAFLDHLERTRRNSPRTRNVRLAAIRTFVRYVLGTAALEFLGPGQRILAIPLKKSSRAALGFMTREEINAVLAATDQNTWSGRRDLILFTLLYNTGARISEALQLRARDMHDDIVLLHGKGRKEREVPLWPQTARRLRRWCTANRIAPDQFVFTNRWAGPLSHDGVSCRLDLAVKQATLQCPSLKGRRITSHRFRN